MNRELINKTIANIIETIKFLDWKLTGLWVQDNFIYGSRILKNGKEVTEGIYAGAEDGKPEDIYNILYPLKRVLDFQGLLVDNDIM